MKQPTQALRYARLIAWIIIAYGTSIVATTLFRQLHTRAHHSLDTLFVTLPVVIGLSYIYLGMLLYRLKYNAWITALALSALTFLFNVTVLLDHDSHRVSVRPVVQHVALPLLVLLLLFAARSAFRVRSDAVGFRLAIRSSVFVLGIALVYGTLGFALLDHHDFHQEISVLTALHQTVDQFGLTTPSVVPHTLRARLFMYSLPTISIGALVYVIVAFFQPIRFTVQPQQRQRALAERLLHDHPSDIDDFFKLWPHDKHYFFDRALESGLAYHVTRGVALVVGDPFGDPKRFLLLGQSFQEFCTLNDWRPVYVHVGTRHKSLYENLGMRLQKIGEEGVVDIPQFAGEVVTGKYFRQIRNRFTKLGYKVEIVKPPYDAALLARLRVISDDWLSRPGRAERGFVLGNHTDDYLRASRLAVVRDATGIVCGFMNLVPTFEDHTANYDLLRCASDAPGNCNDFLLMETLSALQEEGYKQLNLGLCPLKGLEGTESATVLDTALRLIYANGDRFYSFSGLVRFKTKYQPQWDDRYIAYSGAAPGFARAMSALTRAMKVQ